MSVSTIPVAPVAARSLLARVFSFDRALCFTSAVTLVVGAAPIADLLDWPTWVVAAVGASLLPYAALLHLINRRGDLRGRLAKTTIDADFAWVIASFVLVFGWPDETSTVGKWVIAVVALLIADVGIAKIIGLRRLSA